jgi:hypothetical protein
VVGYGQFEVAVIVKKMKLELTETVKTLTSMAMMPVDEMNTATVKLIKW